MTRADAAKPALRAPSSLSPSSFFLWLVLLLTALTGARIRAEDTATARPSNFVAGRRTPLPTRCVISCKLVPLISRDPVSSLTSPGSTQSVRILSAKRHFSKHSFTVVCEVELSGDGWQHSVFDLARFSAGARVKCKRRLPRPPP